nr:hypothetical protein [Lentzea flava]
MTDRSNPSASASGSTSSVTRCAPPETTSPLSRLRLVTSTALDDTPGSSGRTCSALKALSSNTSTRRPASTLRYIPARPSRSSGSDFWSIPSPVSNLRSASSGGTGVLFGANPCRSMNSCPSGKRSTSRCATCTASAVLPIPPVPSIAEITTVRGPDPFSRAHSSAISLSLPTNPIVSCVVWAGRGVFGGAVPLRMSSCCSRSSGPGSTPSCSTSAVRAVRNAASASACRPDRPSASISSPTSRSRTE